MQKSLRKVPQLQTTEIPAPSVPPRCEWLFRQVDVPDEELVACTSWEYLREVASEHFGPAGFPAYAQRLLISYRSHEARRKFNDSFDKIPTNILLILAENPDIALSLQPWQQLDRKLRRKLNQSMPRAWTPLIKMDVVARSVTSWELKMPDPDESAMSRYLPARQIELYAFALAHEARRRLSVQSARSSSEMPVIQRSPDFDNTQVPTRDPRIWLTPYSANELATPAPFLINWGEYTPEEIVAAFSDWIRKVQPKFSPIPRQRGTKLRNLRGALRNLGALRIMHVMPADEFVRRHGGDYELFQQPWGVETASEKLPHVDITKARGRAVRYFQNHFATELSMKPRSWQEPRKTKRRLAAPTGDLPDFTAKRRSKSSVVKPPK